MPLPSITWAVVVALAADLATVPVGTQTAILAQVDRRVVAAAWGDLYVDAKAALAAHLGTLYQRGSAGGVGPVTGMAAGGVSASFAAPPLLGGSLESTVWGQEFLRLQRSRPGLRGFIAC